MQLVGKWHTLKPVEKAPIDCASESGKLVALPWYMGLAV